ncbi:TetR family transcriptional regulator [Nocardioides albertanoniae]|uniref:TetR family transcriptional regulator n=1 Tax=Nocardioides albertanoniae TaxID=1175486 RepID=A0A543A143_9ACTN|nr:TetR family transcriptional regulator [Nocardioides albertanoniae]TQL66240.1 TetR family transcriptional regulator [Nocardioides albertanoniae]
MAAGAPDTTRQRILNAAVEMTTEAGWASVTMSRIAERCGISRQTVYNDIGAKPALAKALILRELEQFLAVVSAAFDQEDDFVAAIREATYGVLDRAQDNKLLHAVVSATHGADTELLPFLSSHSEGLLGHSTEIIHKHITRFDHGLTQPQADAAIEMMVRVVLSHVMQPTRSPDETADDMAWLMSRILAV